MRKQQLKLDRSSRSKTPDRAVRPDLEGLEDRVAGVAPPQSAVDTTIGSLSGWVMDMTFLQSSGSNQAGSASQNAKSSTTSSNPTSTTPGDTTAAVVASSSPMSPAQGIATTAVILGPSPTVLQAVDDALNQLGSDD